MHLFHIRAHILRCFTVLETALSGILHWYSIYVWRTEAAKEPMKWQNTSKSFCPASDNSKQAHCLSGHLLCAIQRDHYDSTCGPRGERGMRTDVTVRSVSRLLPCLSHARRPLRAAHDSLSLFEQRRSYISRRDVKGAAVEKWDSRYSLADAQSASGLTQHSIHSLHMLWISVSR